MVKAVLKKQFLLVQEDEDGELFIEFPDDLLTEMNWKSGDQLIWTEMPNGIGYSVTKTDANSK